MTLIHLRSCVGVARRVFTLTIATAAITLAPACSWSRSGSGEQVFATPEQAVQRLLEVVKAGNVEALITIFGPESRDLVSSSDPATARMNRDTFLAAATEKWQLADDGNDARTLVIGHEKWPFPIPLVKDARGWRFDTAAGKEEVIARRIGRNELAAIKTCLTYVAAQRLYARGAHDGNPEGLFAASVRSTPGMHDGLYWPPKPGEKRSPLGDLLAEAAADGARVDRAGQTPTPFHGYYFKIVTAQGANAPGGAKDYIVNGKLSDGFALVAWPAEYDVTGVMSFVVNQSGTVYSKDLGPDTDSAARAIVAYNPDSTWKSES